MKTGMESIVNTIDETELSHTHSEADSQPFFGVERLEIPQRLLKLCDGGVIPLEALLLCKATSRRILSKPGSLFR